MKRLKQLMVIVVVCGLAFLEGYFLPRFAAELPFIAVGVTALLGTCWMLMRSVA